MDLELVIGTVEEHGYGLRSSGDRILIFANPAEAKVISRFRAGVGGAAYDFIPANDAPAFITDETIVGDWPPGSFNGLRVIGSYGDAWIVRHEYVPNGYVISVASGGPDSEHNPLAFREHKRPELKGLRQLGGSDRYPLVDSYYMRGAGVGVRRRATSASERVSFMI